MKRTALITGASSGFGREFAKIFAQDGFNLVLVARRTEEMLRIKEELEKKYGIQVLVITKDLSKADAADEIFAETQSRNIHIDILVNNAGVGTLGNFADTEKEKVQNMISLNVYSLVTLTHLYLQPMLQKGFGRILNVAAMFII